MKRNLSPVRGAKTAAWQKGVEVGIGKPNASERRLRNWLLAGATGVLAVATLVAMTAGGKDNPQRINRDDIDQMSPDDVNKDFNKLVVQKGDTVEGLADAYAESHPGVDEQDVRQSLSQQAKADGDPTIRPGDTMYLPKTPQDQIVPFESPTDSQA